MHHRIKLVYNFLPSKKDPLELHGWWPCPCILTTEDNLCHDKCVMCNKHTSQSVNNLGFISLEIRLVSVFRIRLLWHRQPPDEAQSSDGVQKELFDKGASTALLKLINTLRGAFNCYKFYVKLTVIGAEFVGQGLWMSGSRIPLRCPPSKRGHEHNVKCTYNRQQQQQIFSYEQHVVISLKSLILKLTTYIYIYKYTYIYWLRNHTTAVTIKW